MTLVIAHRTCPRDATENSVAGIEVAASLGAGAVEMDVRVTRDGALVLHHNALISGVSLPWMPVPLAWISLATTARLSHRSGRTPGLDRALDAARKVGITPVLDVKARSAAPAVVALLEEAEPPAVSLWSQHEQAVACFVRAAQSDDVALVRDTSGQAEGEKLLRDAERLGAHAVTVHWNAVDPGFVQQATDAGLRVYSWCQWRDRHAEKVGLGLAGVVTDWPAEARRAGW